MGHPVQCFPLIVTLLGLQKSVTITKDYTLSIFYKRQPENVNRVSLKFFKNLPRSVSKSVS